ARHHRADGRARGRRLRGERPDQPRRARPDRAQPQRSAARPDDPAAAPSERPPGLAPVAAAVATRRNAGRGDRCRRPGAPVSGPLRILVHNWPLKLGAIALATLLYGGLVLTERSRVFAGSVPIDGLNQPQNVVLLSDLGVVRQIS